nr:hypothetical protein CFP56_21441 [Quercus suber]
MEFISAWFYFDGPAVALLELNGSSSNGASFNEVTVVPGKIDLANLQLSKGRFLAEMGFVDFGVNNVDKIGSGSSELLFQGVDNEGTRQIVVGESDKKDIELIDLGKNPYGSSISFGQELSHALEDSSRTGFGLGPIVIPANPIMFLKGLEAKDCLSCLVAPVQRK